MTNLLRAGLAGLLLALLATGSAAAATVTVRVEGQSRTLLPRTAVTLAPDPDVNCPAASASTALEIATRGNWDRQDFLQTILGETHDYTNNDSWAVWAFRGNRYVATNGACDELLNPGDEVLFGYEVTGPTPDYAPQILPIWISGLPPTVRPGAAVRITVNRTACPTYCNPGEGSVVAQAGASVTGANAAVTSGADGRATVVFGRRGPAGLRATAPNANPSATEATCVTDGHDGYCGTTAPNGTTLPPAVGGASPAARDTAPPRGRLTNIREGGRFGRRRAPRLLKGTVADASGLLQVKLGLTRQVGHRCWTFSGKRERFRRARCGHHPVFKVGDRRRVSYLLPKRLGRGRYVLDLRSQDRFGNRDTLARGRNRVVFLVR